MRKAIPIWMLSIILGQSVNAQFERRYLSDAVLFSGYRGFGSSRSISVGNAGTAGKFESSLSILNPAIAASFPKSELGVTAGLGWSSFNSVLSGQNRNGRSADPILNQVGLVFHIPVPEGADIPIRNQTLVISVNRLGDFTEDIEFAGNNLENGFSDFFIQEATGTNSLELDGSTSLLGLAFENFLFDADPTNCANYNCDEYTRIFPFKEVYQSGVSSSNGNQFQWDLNYGLSFKNGIELGVKVGIATLKFEQEIVLTEAQVDQGPGEYKRSEIRMNRDLSGNGLNLGIGLIYQAGEKIRFGLGFSSGTKFNLKENTTDQIRTEFDGLVWTNPFDAQFSDTLFIEQGSTRQREVKYEFTNPFRVNLGVVYTIPDYWSFSVDLEYVPYSRIGYDFESANIDSKWSRISSELENGFNLRAGIRRHFLGNTAAALGFRYFGDASNSFEGQRLPNMAVSFGYGTDKEFVGPVEWHLVFDYFLPRNSKFYPYAIVNQESPEVDLTLSQFRILLSGTVRF